MSDVVDYTNDVSIHDQSDVTRYLKIETDGSARNRIIGPSGNQADVTEDNELKVNAVLEIAEVIIRDAVTASQKALVTPEGQLKVSTIVEPPPGKTAIEDIQFSSMSDTVDSFTIIPSGEQIKIQRFKGSCEAESNGGAYIALYYAPNGNTSGIVLIDVAVVNGSVFQFDLNYTSEIGNGTKAILLRRTRTSGGSIYVAGKWEGYY